MNKNIIYIFKDVGANVDSVNHIIHIISYVNYYHINTIKTIASYRYRVETVSADTLLAAKWLDNCSLLVMPGADDDYTAKLKGLGSQLIKSYIQNGGSYLGICLGAYYGSQWVEFDKDSPQERLESSGLQFFPGKAVGPLLATFDTAIKSGARSALVEVKFGGQLKNMSLYWNGGPYFEYTSSCSNVTVIGWYQLPGNQKLPAIVSIMYGKGVVVLSGVHIEYAADLFDKSDPYLASFLPDLIASDDERMWLTQQLLRLLNICCDER